MQSPFDLHENIIGLSTTYYATQGYTVYESVRKVTELGFNMVEIGAAHVFEENIWDVLKKIRRDFRRVEFTVHTLFPPHNDRIWFNPADGMSGINKVIVDNLFTAAELLESTYISIHPAVLNEVSLGIRGRGNFYKPEMGESKDRNDCILKFRDLMRYASEKAVRSDVTLMVENLDTTFADSYPAGQHDFLELFQEFPNTGLLLDMGHAFECGNISDLVRLGKYIHEVHIHGSDNVHDNNKRSHSSIKKESYFYPLINSKLNDSVVFLFEHGSDVSEDEIRLETKLLEQFLSDKRLEIRNAEHQKV